MLNFLCTCLPTWVCNSISRAKFFPKSILRSNKKSFVSFPAVFIKRKLSFRPNPHRSFVCLAFDAHMKITMANDFSEQLDLETQGMQLKMPKNWLSLQTRRQLYLTCLPYCSSRWTCFSNLGRTIKFPLVIQLFYPVSDVTMISIAIDGLQIILIHLKLGRQIPVSALRCFCTFFMLQENKKARQNYSYSLCS